MPSSLDRKDLNVYNYEICFIFFGQFSALYCLSCYARNVANDPHGLGQDGRLNID